MMELSSGNTTRGDVALWLAVFFRVVYGPRNLAKRLARLAGVSPRTAEGWVSARRAPGLNALLRLMAACPDLHTAINDDVELLRRAEAASARAGMILHETDSNPGAWRRAGAAAPGHVVD